MRKHDSISFKKDNQGNEWEFTVTMEINQIKEDLSDLKDNIKEIYDISKNIEKEVYSFKKEEEKIKVIEEELKSFQISHSNLKGKFKVAGSVVSVFIASLFGWILKMTSKF